MEPSCSDCKVEIIERRWSQLLLKWINKCVSTYHVFKLNPLSLADVMAKYNRDVCADDIDRAILCTDDVEPFIKYKYPILRLHYLCEENERAKRLFITTTMILYHCCMNSKSGAVDEDICKTLSKYEQELILKFCENLCEMEATVNNVERAIIGAFEVLGIIEDPDQEPETPSEQTDIDITALSDTNAQISLDSTIKGSMATIPSDGTLVDDSLKQLTPMTFNSSITVMPSVIDDNYSDLTTESDDVMKDTFVDSDGYNVYAMGSTKDKIKTSSYSPKRLSEKRERGASRNIDEHAMSKHTVLDKGYGETKEKDTITSTQSQELRKGICPSKCVCSNSGTCCGDPANSLGICKPGEKRAKWNWWSNLGNMQCSKSMKIYIVSLSVLLLVIIAVVAATIPFIGKKKTTETKEKKMVLMKLIETKHTEGYDWQCVDGLCQKAYLYGANLFTSYSRCSLICMGPQLWPYPIGYTFFSNKIVALSTNRLEYKFQSIPSEAVHQYLAEAFKMFIGHLARLENNELLGDNKTMDLTVKKMSIQIDVETDADPRLRLNTEEAYHLKIETVNKKVIIQLSSSSFCGVRHGLETLSQLILQDQSTGKLITLSSAVIKDAPTYRYRGLMIDTGRNYIPVTDLMRTIDAMASVKLNTFHWRISDVTSFPLFLPTLPQLFEYGAYDRSSIYTTEDIRAIVSRAGFKGIRVLIEVAAPGPVGRPWSWSPDVYCPSKNENLTCDNNLCLRMLMRDSIFTALRMLYSHILDITKVDDIFHLSDGIFSMTNCFFLIEDRDGYLDKILATLQQANKGFLPKLPVIWHSPHLLKDYEAKTWERLGVQLNDVDHEANANYLSRFKVIHSSKWDLSCEMKKYRCRKYRTWQEMYSWKSWRNIEVFTIEGGEAVLWTDLVNAGNLDSHLWPRAAAVAERLWSDTVLNVTVTGDAYVRLDSQRWRMLFQGINVQPVWPIWCSYHPGICLEKLQQPLKK